MVSTDAAIPEWAFEVLACPRCGGGLEPAAADLSCAHCGVVGRVDRGVACFEVDTREDAVAFYEAVQGPRLHERMGVPYTTSSLDGPVYHAMLSAIDLASPDALVVDTGAGDGRNTDAWLERGPLRVVATDAVLPPLLRLRDRIAEAKPADLERLLLVKADVRNPPLRAACADVVMAIEVLCLLGKEYEAAVKACAGLVAPGGSLVVSDYAAEGALLTRLLYGGVSGLLEVARSGALPLESGDVSTQLRLLQPHELAGIVRECGLDVVEERGLSILAPLFGFLRGLDQVSDADEELFPQVVELMEQLSVDGRMRRVEAVVARRPA